MNIGIEKAITFFGSQANLAKELEVKRMNIQYWKKSNASIPIKRCLQIEQLTNGAVTRQDLRPDDYWEIWPDLLKEKI